RLSGRHCGVHRSYVRRPRHCLDRPTGGVDRSRVYDVVGRSAPSRPPLRSAPKLRPAAKALPWPPYGWGGRSRLYGRRRAVGAFPAATTECTEAASGGQGVALDRPTGGVDGVVCTAVVGRSAPSRPPLRSAPKLRPAA